MKHIMKCYLSKVVQQLYMYTRRSGGLGAIHYQILIIFHTLILFLFHSGKIIYQINYFLLLVPHVFIYLSSKSIYLFMPYLGG